MIPPPPNFKVPDEPDREPRKGIVARIMSLPNGSLIGAFVLFLVLVWILWPQRDDKGGMVREKTSRARIDLKHLETALELYRNDLGAYPTTLSSLTTPTAYIDNMPTDPWSDTRSSRYRYHCSGTSFIVGSFGPDADEATGGDLPWSDSPGLNELLLAIRPALKTRRIDDAEPVPVVLVPFTYDATNGTFSEGDIWRLGTAPDEPKASETKP